MKRLVARKAPLTALQLDDSVAPDHACFADSTDVFTIIGGSAITLWRV
jgi:hypothetical protein